MSLEYYLKTYYDAVNLTKLPKTANKGMQEKFNFLDNEDTVYFVKKDTFGCESLAETTVSDILFKCTNLDRDLLMEYELISIGKDRYCISKDFKKAGEDEVTLEFVLKSSGLKIDKVYENFSAQEKLSYLAGAVERVTGSNFLREFKTMLAVDAFFLNGDRHTNNISFLEDSLGNFRFSPIFDNGKSLMSSEIEKLSDETIGSRINKIKTHSLIHTSPRKQVELYDLEPFLYRGKLLDYISENKKELGLMYDILKYQVSSSYYSHLIIDNRLVNSSLFS